MFHGLSFWHNIYLNILNTNFHFLVIFSVSILFRTRIKAVWTYAMFILHIKDLHFTYMAMYPWIYMDDRSIRSHGYRSSFKLLRNNNTWKCKQTWAHLPTLRPGWKWGISKQRIEILLKQILPSVLFTAMWLLNPLCLASTCLWIHSCSLALQCYCKL